MIHPYARDPLARHLKPEPALVAGAFPRCVVCGVLTHYAHRKADAGCLVYTCANGHRMTEQGEVWGPLPFVERTAVGVVIRSERLPKLEHAKPGLVACAEQVRRRFVRTWVQHLAECPSIPAQAQAYVLLTRVLAETSAIAWCDHRNSPDLTTLRCPLTDPWFERDPWSFCDRCERAKPAGELAAGPGGAERYCQPCADGTGPLPADAARQMVDREFPDEEPEMPAAVWGFVGWFLLVMTACVWARWTR